MQPCRAFEQDQARFEVEFDGEPIPTIKWYREDFLIQNSPDFQIHTFSTKSILVIRQVIILALLKLGKNKVIYVLFIRLTLGFHGRLRCIRRNRREPRR
jgi:hypothetical protein